MPSQRIPPKQKSLTALKLFGLGLILALGGGSAWKHFYRPHGVPATAFAGSPHPSSRAAGKPIHTPHRLESFAEARPIAASLNHEPIFELNLGQTDPAAKFLSRGSGYTLFLTDSEAVFSFRSQNSAVRGQKQERGPWLTVGGQRGSADLFSRSAALLIEPRPADLNDQSALQGPNPAPSLQPPAPEVLRMKLVGANPRAAAVGVDKLPSKSNYFIGQDPRRWRTNVPNYAGVWYRGIYPGVDLVYYGRQQRLEYDFTLAPGISPESIVIQFERAMGGQRFERNQPVRLNARGDVVLVQAGEAEVLLHKPVIYQTTSDHVAEGPGSWLEGGSGKGRRILIAGGYELRGNNQVSFKIGPYDKTQTLVIDPVLSYSSYLGGSLSDSGNAIAIDSSGNAYVAGATFSANFPTVAPFQSTCAACAALSSNAFITEINASGSALVYSTYLGGSTGDSATGIAVDSSGNAYVTGVTSSADFPTVNAVQPTYGGNQDAFVAKLNAGGSSLGYSTYLGGSGADAGAGIAIDASGDAYVTGSTVSVDFPTVNALQPTCTSCALGTSNAFVTELNGAGSAIVYSTYLGGSNADAGAAIAVDSTGNAYLAGGTTSNNFPTANAFQNSFGGVEDAFVTKLNASGSAIVYSTYLGGTGRDSAAGIALDSSGNAYVTGSTSSTDFPTLNPIQPTLIGSVDAFVAKLNASGAALVYSTYLGGSSTQSAAAVAVDSLGQAYIIGSTTSTDFPTANALQTTYAGNQDAFISKFSATGNSLVYSSYLGGHAADTGNGIAVSSAGNVYLTGSTFSNDFPTANPFQPATGGSYDAFVTEITNLAAPTVILSPTTVSFAGQGVGTSSSPQTVTLTNDGDATLTITGVSITGDFTESDNCVGSVNIGATCSITLTFTPSVEGARTGTLTITDDASGSPQSVPLSGTGLLSVAILSPSSLSFANQGLDITSPAQTVTLTNPGNLALSISNVAISGDFAETNTCGATLAAGSNCSFTITFTPSALGVRTGTLTLTDNASDSPQTLPLQGAGVVAFSLSATNSTSTIGRGTDSTTFIVSASTSYGFTNYIGLSCAGVAPAVCAFKLAYITPGQSSTLTVSNLSAFSGTSLNFVVNGTSGSQTASLALTVQIQDYSILASPTAATVTAGGSTQFTLSLTPINGFKETVSLSCSGAPTQATCSITPTSITLDGTNTSTATATAATTSRSNPGPGPSTPLRILPVPNVPITWLVCVLVFSVLAALAWQKEARLRVALVLSLLLWLAAAGCAVGGPATQGTPAGTYTLVFTGTTSSALTRSTNVTLTVN